MYYIEFFSRREDVPVEHFHEVVKNNHRNWQAQHPEDQLVLCLGRTWRMGPKPVYMAIWKIPNFARIDEWTRMFHEEQEAVLEHSKFEDVAIIEDAGVYEDIGQEQL